MTQIDPRAATATVADVRLVRQGSRPVLVRAFPAERHFADDVQRIVLELASEAGDDDTIRERLETTLRAWYPRLSVHERTDFGALDGAEMVWYVLRDGRVRPDDPRIDRIHAALATAREVSDDAETAIRHAREAVAMVAGRHGARSNADVSHEEPG